MFDEKGNTVPGDSSKAVKAELAAYDNTTWAVHPSTGTVVSNQLRTPSSMNICPTQLRT